MQQQHEWVSAAASRGKRGWPHHATRHTTPQGTAENKQQQPCPAAASTVNVVAHKEAHLVRHPLRLLSVPHNCCCTACSAVQVHHCCAVAHPSCTSLVCINSTLSHSTAFHAVLVICTIHSCTVVVHPATPLPQLCIPHCTQDMYYILPRHYILTQLYRASTP